MNTAQMRRLGLSAIIATSISLGAVPAFAQTSTPVATPSGSPVVCHDDNTRPGELVDGKEYQDEAKVSLDDAIATAQDEVDGEVGEIELDREDGKLIYEVEIGTDEVLIDAETGEVIRVRPNDDCETMIGDVRFEDDDRLVDTVSITPEKAIEIAQGEVDGTVRKVELEKDDGKTVYKVDIEDSEVKIDAESGDVIEVERDRQDDQSDDHDDHDDEDDD